LRVRQRPKPSTFEAGLLLRRGIRDPLRGRLSLIALEVPSQSTGNLLQSEVFVSCTDRAHLAAKPVRLRASGSEPTATRERIKRASGYLAEWLAALRSIDAAEADAVLDACFIAKSEGVAVGD